MDSPARAALEPGQRLMLGVRPEHLDAAGGIALEANVDVVEQLGATSFVYATLATGEPVIAEKRLSPPKSADKVTLSFALGAARLFSQDGARIR
jgi:lactose/L-arabinose transport system ATP-binding protein